MKKIAVLALFAFAVRAADAVSTQPTNNAPAVVAHVTGELPQPSCHTCPRPKGWYTQPTSSLPKPSCGTCKNPWGY